MVVEGAAHQRTEAWAVEAAGRLTSEAEVEEEEAHQQKAVEGLDGLRLAEEEAERQQESWEGGKEEAQNARTGSLAQVEAAALDRERAEVAQVQRTDDLRKRGEARRICGTSHHRRESWPAPEAVAAEQEKIGKELWRGSPDLGRWYEQTCQHRLWEVERGSVVQEGARARDSECAGWVRVLPPPQQQQNLRRDAMAVEQVEGHA